MRVSLVVAVWAEYAIYGDCGSTATRIYLIEAAASKYSIEKVGKGPAITSILQDGDNAGKIAALVGKALDKVPAAERSRVGVRAMATAGMRDHSDDDQQAVWRALRTALTDCRPESCPAVARILTECDGAQCFEKIAFRTITGQEEGAFGLVAANALVPDTVGTLDLGGSSTQVALPHSDVADPVDLAKPGAGGESFVRSYLWGMEKARQRLATRDCFGTDVELSGVIPGGDGFGAPDAAKCRSAIRSGLQRASATCLDRGELGCLGEQVPWKAARLLAMSGFFYVADFAEHVARSHGSSVAGYPTPRFEALAAAAKYVCSGAARELVVGNPHPFTGGEKLLHRCFELNYLLELFDLYSVPNDSRVEFVGSIDGTEVEWTLGAYLVDRQQEHGEYV